MDMIPVDPGPYLTLHAMERFCERILQCKKGENVRALKKNAHNGERIQAWLQDTGFSAEQLISLIITPEVISAINCGANKISVPSLDCKLCIKSGKVTTVVKMQALKKRAGRLSKSEFRRLAARDGKRFKSALSGAR